MGRPPSLIVTEEQRQLVTVLAANGVPIRTIARSFMKVSENTLRKYYKEELDEGFQHVNASMGAALVKAGLAGNVLAIKYWMAVFGGPEWRVKEAFENTYDPNDLRTTETVHIYMPPNHRDEPDTDDDPPTIDGEAEAA